MTQTMHHPTNSHPRWHSVLLPLLLFFMITSSADAVGQLPRAKQEMDLYRYAEALPYLEQALEKGKPSETTETLRLLATCYRKMNLWQEAGTFYRKAMEAGDPDPETRWYAALSLYRSGAYAAAKSAFTNIPTENPFSADARRLAALCDSALWWLTLPEQYTIISLRALNSPQSEFGAIPLREGLLFTSDRLPDQRETKRYGWTGNGYLTLYLQPMDSITNHSGFSGIPADSSLMPSGLSLILPDSSLMPVPFIPGLPANAHNGPATLTSAEDKLMINRTLSARDKGSKKEGSIRTHLLKIYTLSHTDAGWPEPEPFFLNSGDYSVGHPALSPDGHTLMFVSDMPGGFGGTDLYRCTWKEDHWSDPVNLGNRINTAGNEMFPYLLGDTLLWFASDGHPGFGGLDLYMAGVRTGLPEALIHPGYPLNTAWDDFSLSTADGGLSGWFSSNRPGGKGSDDIYLFLKRAQGEEHRAQGEEHRAQGEEHRAQGDSLPFGVDVEYVLEDIFYDFDQWAIREDAKPALDSLVRIMQAWPVTIELGSHTDCRGDEGYNLVLSQKRAEAAVQYITGKGIAPERISAKGYGKTRLINGCDCAPHHPCTEAEHQQNRRTTFMIKK